MSARGQVGTVTWGQALARGDMLAREHGDMGRDTRGSVDQREGLLRDLPHAFLGGSAT